jgi:hypothetical protein
MTFTQQLVSNVKNLDMFKTLASRWSSFAHQSMPTTGNEELDIPALYDDPLY